MIAINSFSKEVKSNVVVDKWEKFPLFFFTNLFLRYIFSKLELVQNETLANIGLFQEKRLKIAASRKQRVPALLLISLGNGKSRFSPLGNVELGDNSYSCKERVIGVAAKFDQGSHCEWQFLFLRRKSLQCFNPVVMFQPFETLVISNAIL